ncbi:M56 family metallopeptidase [Streptomyces radicis]|uniref:M56 family peptidase n=1 Tax=Streptomyces radicis TaxID=1750517 RepID=A0A3A9WCV1_9ACTN|nr:M56 family metallopeptidase [Streptomyces radicis]RKN10123.1 M56 family peptidase [Streptomyces radicis]RKN24465.1 M56 family peptidase [Streptomyces radicis]
MLVILALLTHALVLGGPVARLLSHAAWTRRSPRIALRLWHTNALGFLASCCAVLLLAAHDAWEHAVVWLFHADKPQVHAAYTGSLPVEGIADVALVALLTCAGAISALAARRSLRVRGQRARHRLATDALAERDGARRGNLRVLDHDAPAAFCIPGQGGRARIVLTTGALRLLGPDQLAATVEHERAHLRLRHHRAILLADVITAAVGWTGLLRDYAAQVRRLVEMAADDQAAQRHGRRTVASALLDMCSQDPEDQAVGTVSMTGPDPAERIRRLLEPPSPTPRRRALPALALCAGAALLALPAAVSLAPAAAIAGTAHGEGDPRGG